MRKLVVAVALVAAAAGGCSCSGEPYEEWSDPVRVTLTADAPAVEGDLVVRINDRVRGEWWDPEPDPEASALEDQFQLRIELSPMAEGVRVSLVPVDGPEALVVPNRLGAVEGHEGIPVDGWHRESRTSFVGGGRFDVTCPLDEPCEVAFRYRIERVAPLEPGERVEVTAEAMLRANENSPKGSVARHDGAEMTVELGPPAAADPIAEAIEIGSVPVTGRKHRGRIEVPVTIRFPEPADAEVVRFLTLTDPEVRFVQDRDLIRDGGWQKVHLEELPLMVGDCGDDGCAIHGRLVTEVEPDVGSLTFWATLRSGWNLHDPPSGLEVEVDLAAEALPPPAWMAEDTDD